MPLVPDDRMQFALDRAVEYIRPPEENQASFKEKMISAFRLNNTIGSLITENGNLPDGYADTDFDVFSKLTPQEKENKDFVKLVSLADNVLELDAVRNQYARENKDREMLSGVDGFATGLIAGVFDPINLIPVGGTAFRAYKSGGVLKGALATGAVATGTAGVTEVALHQTQLTRTKEESALNVSGAFLLGSALGGLASALTPGTVAKAGKEIDTTIDGPMVNTITDAPMINPAGQSAGAAAVWGDVHIKGPLVEKALSALSPIDPVAKIMTARAASARKYGAVLFENPLQLEVRRTDVDGSVITEAFDGKSIEQLSRGRHQAVFNRGLMGYLDEFESLKKTGEKMKRKEFAELVTKELRNPGATGNKFALNAANHIAETVYDPIAKELQKLKMLGDDLDPVTAMRYANRRWDKNVIAARLGDFEAKVTQWLKETQPEIVDPEELASDIALKIMGSPDGTLRYDAVIREAVEDSAKVVDDAVDVSKLDGVMVDEKVFSAKTGKSKKEKANAKKVYERLQKQKKALKALKDCLGA